MIIHHITDAHEWHFASIGHTHVSVPLPLILYSPGKGLEIFLSNRLHDGLSFKGYRMEHGKVVAGDGSVFYNISMTKNVISMLISAILLCLIFISISRRYIKYPKEAPKGMQSLLEPVILFIRDEVAKPILHDQSIKYLPYLLTVFFFIWINNLLGLMPGSANVTGNIAVTMTLALFTFVIILFSSGKRYWQHIFMPPGVPVWVMPVIVVVEFVGVFVKPFALMVRLFANITAGHMIILSIIGLIFIFGAKNPFLGYGVSVLSVAFALFMFLLELLVAVLQAYIFTILSTLFISEAAASGHHEEHA